MLPQHKQQLLQRPGLQRLQLLQQHLAHPVSMQQQAGSRALSGLVDLLQLRQIAATQQTAAVAMLLGPALHTECAYELCKGHE
jgi:hypothetical protein